LQGPDGFLVLFPETVVKCDCPCLEERNTEVW